MQNRETGIHFIPLEFWAVLNKQGEKNELPTLNLKK